MNIIIFGHKNAGKTTLGKALSKTLNRPLIDTDKEIEALYFRKNGLLLNFQEIYLKHKESYFRELEKEVILSLKCQKSIITLGGGSLMDPETRSFISQLGLLFYLKISEETFLKRGLLNPYHTNDPDLLKKIYLERTFIFESLKAFEIDSSSINSQIEKITHVIK